MTAHINATVAGVPRIGPRRELKKALEAYWKDSTQAQALADTAKKLTTDFASYMQQAGLDSVPSLGRSYYDAVLDATALFQVLPQRVADVADHTGDDLPQDIDRYFTAARGTTGIPAAAMTKWFDTNYHYIVPELSKDTEFSLAADNFIADISSQQHTGVHPRPVIVGPLTFLSLARTEDGSDPRDLLEKLAPLYGQLIEKIGAETGVEWIQIDEPELVTDIDPDTAVREDLLRRTRAVYQQLSRATHKKSGTKLLVQTYFGDGDTAVDILSGTGVDAIGVDLVTGRTDERANEETYIPDEKLLPSWDGEILLLAGVVDGRNVWRTDLGRALKTLRALASRGPIAVSTSCSLQHVPYSLAQETSLDNDQQLRSWLAFGEEKIQEVAILSRLLRDQATAQDQQAVVESGDAIADRAQSSRTHNVQLRQRTSAITDADRTRVDYTTRQQAQQKALNLPPLPTTTIGSFPQTATIRAARAEFRRGNIDAQAYEHAMQKEVELVIRRQEELGLDVLVHGEPERNDMVQYFSEQLEGYHSTDLAWVQSYGSRCVRPPILFGDVVRENPMTVQWFRYAQSLTDKPVKGMLTGPVTMLAWSFVRDDQPLGDTADQVALALRDEISDLAEAGAKIVQVDEPAIRELLPLRSQQQAEYLNWSVGSFRLATSGAQAHTQIHTHMCYSKFNELIDAVEDLDADVTSIEASRNGMRVLAALKESGFNHGVGPGVWDIHSPRVPDDNEVEGLVRDALACVDPEALWINPDCGLKTRGWEETTASLRVLVSAAQHARKQLESC